LFWWLICFWCDVFFVFLGGDWRRILSKIAAEAATDAAAGRAEVIVASTCQFVVIDGADRVRSIVLASAAVSGGREVSPPLIYPIS